MTSVVGTNILTVAAGDEDPHRSKFWEIWLASIAVYDKSSPQMCRFVGGRQSY